VTEEERAVVCALRRSTHFALDELTFVVTHCWPPLNRDSLGRMLKAEGLNRRPTPASSRPLKGTGTFKEYDLGFIPIDMKHLPQWQTSNGEKRKRYLYLALDRRSRSVPLAVRDDETEKSALAFLREAAAAFPFPLTPVLTDNGSGFTPALAPACVALGAEYRPRKPYTSQTNGRVERFHRRVRSEVLGIAISSHRDLEPLRRGFNAAYKARRQRVLDGKTPHQVVSERLQACRQLAHTKTHGHAGPDDIAQARLLVEAAQEVSQPNIGKFMQPCSGEFLFSMLK
jgi:transposase InsO family protein